ncbi:MAG: PAS domain-containing sensor histidine kinase [Rhodovarius sp.]|nr:PAS domain-containing sensor histidine kinase [Rhodovarius sp.]MCX7931990.1 PAS domain-containing sensor histidine kinase [Rhodovarius sp.]MDW8313953.1 PAS domain-containing sensor histidine kinase [Rhodovarius sp.]
MQHSPSLPLPADSRLPPAPAPAPGQEGPGLLRRLTDILLGGGVTLGLAVGALVLAIATFVVLADGSPFGPTHPGLVVGLVLTNTAFVLLLLAALAGRLVRVWVERRQGRAGSRLHTRLVVLFAAVAIVPALLVAGFAAFFFNVGISAWFSDRVRVALHESLAASRAYLAEHQQNIRADALAMANDLNRAVVLLPEQAMTFARVLATQAGVRGLTEAVVFEPVLGRVIAHAGVSTSMLLEPPPPEAVELARMGEVAVLAGDDSDRARAVVSLAPATGLMLMIARPVDPQVIEHMRRTEAAVEAYQNLDRNREGLQVTFVMIFAVAALLVLLAAILIGLVLANQLARPIGRLIRAAERVRQGDLAVRVEEGSGDDEVATLSRAFNRMTNELAAQRNELMEAYRQLDERRRFTEGVLAGVSAGVIGLDADGLIELANRRASELLGRDLDAALGRPLPEAVPELAPLFEQAAAGRDAGTLEVRIGPPSARRTLLARIAPEAAEGSGRAGFVVTFDDITALLAAQRQAAWADVAQRIAHEIKNPLTPIQLSAERLKRRYLRQITEDPDTFLQMTDTIVRQVGDMRRMVDEFSGFARMPQPVIKPEPIARIIEEALVLQREAHPHIAYALDVPELPLLVPCDRRLIGQALTNLLANAADAIAMRMAAEAAESGAAEGQDGVGATGAEDLPAARSGPAGHITVAIRAGAEAVVIEVTDDGIGLPAGEERERLTEPYVTHKPKGTGLGLAIVKKILEDHGGRLLLADAPGGRGAQASLVLPWRGSGEHAMERARSVAETRSAG